MLRDRISLIGFPVSTRGVYSEIWEWGPRNHENLEITPLCVGHQMSATCGLGSEPGPGFHVRRVVLCPQIFQRLTFCQYICPASISAC